MHADLYKSDQKSINLCSGICEVLGLIDRCEWAKLTCMALVP